MIDTNKKILDLVSRGATANEISNETNLSNRQLFYRMSLLELKGYNFKKKYYYNGEIVYGLNKTIEPVDTNILYTRHSDTSLKFLLLSDLHLSSEYEKIKYLNDVYDFCKKEKINIILNCGDIIDGSIGFGKRKFEKFEDQINYAIKIIPFDKYITTYALLGNHDFDSLKKSGQDLSNALKSRRHDIVPIGYGMGSVLVKNDEIILKHPQTPMSNIYQDLKNKLVLYGHTHKVLSTSDVGNNLVNYYVASLSDIHPAGCYDTLPGFSKVTLETKGGYFNKGIFENFIFLDGIYKAGEVIYLLGEGKNLSSKSVKYEDNVTFRKEKEKQLTKRIN